MVILKTKREKFMNKKSGFLIIALFLSISAFAGPREQAYRMHNRLIGIPPTPAVLTQMAAYIASGNAYQAATTAMENHSFYNLKLKTWFKEWTNTEMSNRIPLNDYVATMIGMVRDEVPFNEVLNANKLYVGFDSSTPTITYPNGISDPTDDNYDPRSVVDGHSIRYYSRQSNAHYQDLENKNIDLHDFLTVRNQQTLNGIADYAGVITTRQSGNQFFRGGTNRRVTRFLFINFLCHDFEALHDTNVADYKVRRDISRSPGGDSRLYLSQCKGCHAGQDALGGAFAYFEFEGGRRLRHRPGQVEGKMNKNSQVFPSGHTVTDDSWINTWHQGQNAFIGWPSTTSGNGARSLGTMLTQTDAFGKCMAQRSFKMVCAKEAQTQAEKDFIDTNAAAFMGVDNFNMKTLIAKTATGCMGE